MKIERLNAKARQICLGISNHRTKSFKDTSFAKAFGEFCAVTDYQDTDPDNFLVYVKLYGQDDRFRNRNFQSGHSQGGRTWGHTRMMPNGYKTKSYVEEEEGLPEQIEQYRVEMMRRMINANQ